MTERAASGRIWRRPGWLLRLHRVRPNGCRLWLWTTRHGCSVVKLRVGHTVKLPGVGAVVRLDAVHPHPGDWFYAVVEVIPAVPKPRGSSARI